jgi:3-hydroxyisobutyrate dehydrogenase
MKPIANVAFIGLGNMGVPMAARLVAQGFSLALFDVRPEASRGFVAAHGGRAAGSLTDALRDAEAVITMLPTHDLVHEVMLDGGGVASTLAAGSVAIDMGTSDPRATVEIGSALQSHGIAYVDAPVMGGVVFARNGSLDVLAGGRNEDIDRCLPIFTALGRRVLHCGALGSGHALKALANYVNAGALVTLIEALAIGRKFGLDTGMMANALVDLCAGRQHPLEKKVIPEVLTRKFGSGMALGLIAKDVSIAADFGHSIGAMTSIVDCVRDVWCKAVAEVGYNADQTEVARLWEKSNGIEL